MKLEDVIALCNCGVYLYVNEHKDNYQSVKEYIEDNGDWFGGLQEDVLQKMIDKDTIITLQCYVNTPIGFLLTHGHNLQEIVDHAFNYIQCGGE